MFVGMLCTLRKTDSKYSVRALTKDVCLSDRLSVLVVITVRERRIFHLRKMRKWSACARDLADLRDSSTKAVIPFQRSDKRSLPLQRF
jgi:hypothetical protein